MKIIKGFYDEQGNYVQVQGAGTQYNPELNSLALGEDTILAGENQFVFGKCNLPSADKVEIVGGGYKATENIVKYELGEEILDFGKFSTEHNIFYGGVTLEQCKIALNNMLQIPVENINFVSNHLTEDYWNNHTFFIISQQNATDGIRFSCNVFNPDSSKWKKVVLYINNNHRSKPEDITDTSIITLDPSLVLAYDNAYPFLDKIRNSMAFIITNEKNIRTLDWEGNQNLAGKLISKQVIITDNPTKESLQENAIPISKYVKVEAEEISLVQANGGGKNITIKIPAKTDLYNICNPNQSCVLAVEYKNNHLLLYPISTLETDDIYRFNAHYIDFSQGEVLHIFYEYDKKNNTSNAYVHKETCDGTFNEIYVWLQ